MFKLKIVFKKAKIAAILRMFAAFEKFTPIPNVNNIHFPTVWRPTGCVIIVNLKRDTVSQYDMHSQSQKCDAKDSLLTLL